jgi:hypothetical protein
MAQVRNWGWSYAAPGGDAGGGHQPDPDSLRCLLQKEYSTVTQAALKCHNLIRVELRAKQMTSNENVMDSMFGKQFRRRKRKKQAPASGQSLLGFLGVLDKIGRRPIEEFVS